MMIPSDSELRIAVLIPCYNEAPTISAVIHDFKKYLPDARIIVFDNHSSDDSIKMAQEAGAEVSRVALRGKGQVIRRIFSDVDADIYVMVDGDDTYDAGSVPQMIHALVTQHLDMVVGQRITDDEMAYRLGHRSGNRLLTRFTGLLFGYVFNDMLSGYRVFSRRYVKSFPAHSSGFEIETELTLHAYQLRMPVAEVQTRYKSRPEGSYSKLNTYSDGLRILYTIFRLFKAEKPFVFFLLAFLLCALTSVVLAFPVFETYLETGLVPRFPTAILCASLMLLGVILFACGIVLDSVAMMRLEIKHLAYLSASSGKQKS